MRVKTFFSKSFYFNFALLMVLFMVWCISYSRPVIEGLRKQYNSDEDLLYGRISYAAIPSVFGGSNIPFLDKTYFRINGNNDLTFLLYGSEKMLDEMSVWFDFSAIDVGEVPLEIRGVRISKNRFIVTSIASSDGDLNYAPLQYQIRYVFIYFFLCVVAFVIAIKCFVKFIHRR